MIERWIAKEEIAEMVENQKREGEVSRERDKSVVTVKDMKKVAVTEAKVAGVKTEAGLQETIPRRENRQEKEAIMNQD